MGGKVSSLDKVPVYPGINTYIFVINVYKWEDSVGKKLDDDFFSIARNIAEDAIIISPLKYENIFAGNLRNLIVTQLTEDKKKRWKGEFPEDLMDFLAKVQILGEMVWREGGLIILEAHPSQLTSDDLVLAIPMRGIKNNYERIEEFLTDLCEFTKGRNPGFAEKFDEIEDKEKHGVSELLQYFELKPSICGLALNLSAILERLLSNKPNAA